SHIFNLAGEISHIHSMRRPERDAELNARAQLRFLEECMRQAPRVRVVYASTRQIYGAPRYLPVDEAHPVSPIDFNGVHKYVASAYHEMFTGVGRLDAISLRLTNVYGPRMALRIPCQGFLGTFLRRAMRQQPIEIFGDGRQMRDPVYVDDAVDAFLLAGAARHPVSRVYNVGGPETHSLARIATIVSDAAGAPAPVFRPFPADLRPIDIGSYSSDTRSICNELGWQPRVFLRQGICQSVAYFRRHLDQYLGPEDSEASCPLEAAWESQAH
ncbi:MAG: NAD-dependent epimerase, partial [Terriglobia bacterium]